MAKNTYHNYLKLCRKKHGLSQDDLARLLGCKNGAKASRYETLKRKPGLDAALTYEALFDVPTRELFWRLFAEMEELAVRRVQKLAEELRIKEPRDRAAIKKLTALESILRKKQDVLLRSHEK